MGNLNFNTSGYNYSPSQGRTLFPDGDYNVVITDTREKDSKTPGNRFVEITHRIEGGPYNDDEYVYRMNLWNTNNVAVKIAQDRLFELCHAIGVPTVENHEDLRFKRVVIELKTKPPREGQEKYGPSNELKAYKAIGGSMPQAAGEQSAPTPGAAPTAPVAAQPPAAAPASNQPPPQAPSAPPNAPWGQ